MPSAWERMNSDQVGPSRRGAGWIPARRRIVLIVVAPTLWPSPCSSPFILQTPQRGLSFAIEVIKATSSGARGGRPVFSCLKVHLRLTSSRCQRRRVSGLTGNALQRLRGSVLAAAAKKILSMRRSRRRPAFLDRTLT